MTTLQRSRPFLHTSSSSSFGATTLGGFWPALRFLSTIFDLHTSLSSFSLLSSLNPLLLAQAISVLVFLLVLTWFPFSYSAHISLPYLSRCCIFSRVDTAALNNHIVVFVGLTPYKRVQRKIFGSKGDKVAGQWRRLHSEKLYYLHSSRNVIRVTK